MQNYNPWITRGIRISCNNKRILYLSCRNSNDKNLKNRYKRYSQTLSNVIKAAKKIYNDEIISKSKNRTKTTWEIIKKETGKCKRHNSIEALMNKNTMVNNPQEIAQNFNDYFSTVASNIIDNIKKDDTNGRMGDASHPSHLNYLNNNLNTTFANITWKHTSTYEISKIIESLNTSNSCGYDEVPTKIIKLSAPCIVSPLTHICNKAFSAGTFPERLKYALIRPVHKKGNKLIITNYRPISLLASFSKIFEKLIFTRLYKHLTTNQILVKEQFDFRCNSSTENAAYNVMWDTVVLLGMIVTVTHI
jgi:Notch-like protein